MSKPAAAHDLHNKLNSDLPDTKEIRSLCIYGYRLKVAIKIVSSAGDHLEEDVRLGGTHVLELFGSDSPIGRAKTLAKSFVQLHDLLKRADSLSLPPVINELEERLTKKLKSAGLELGFIPAEAVEALKFAAHREVEIEEIVFLGREIMRD